MSPGVITGGWEFVWSVYGLSFAVYTAYSAWVMVRWKRECHIAEPHGHRSR
jgi:hypothetical protein